MSVAADEAAVVAAVRAGDQAEFGALVEPYRRQLHVHCYRMLGSFEDAEDMVQETLLRAWRSRARFEGRSLFRTWLYRIATNVCLTALARARRRVMPSDVAPASDPRAELVWGMLEDWKRGGERDRSKRRTPEIPWLQPYPDHLLEPTAPRQTEPEAVVVARETIEIAFMIAMQHLPPRQRAVLILRDVLGWSAKETATLLESGVASVNSALRRARSTMRALLPSGRFEPTPATEPSDAERSTLERFMAALESGDGAALSCCARTRG